MNVRQVKQSYYSLCGYRDSRRAHRPCAGSLNKLAATTEDQEVLAQRVVGKLSCDTSDKVAQLQQTVSALTSTVSKLAETVGTLIREVGHDHGLDLALEKGDRVVSRRDPRQVPIHAVTIETLAPRNGPNSALSPQKFRLARGSGDGYPKCSTMSPNSL